jgi:hypothetical protein
VTARPYAEHYARFDALVRGMAALTDTWNGMSRFDQGAVLELLLPGVADLQDCWAELVDPLQRLAHLDARDALDELREQGARGPLDPASAYDRVRASIEHEIADVLRQYRGVVTTEQVAVLAVAR